MEIDRASVPANSEADAIISAHQPVVTAAAASDEAWRSLGLIDIAVAASLRDNALIPLISSGRMLGYLQVGHHVSTSPAFAPDELRLMNIVASQAAAIIENVLLVQQSRVRALRADALRRIASLAGSSASLNEILKYSVQELARLFNADMGAILLMDDSRGELRLRREASYGLLDEISDSFVQISVEDPDYRFTVSGSQRPLLSSHLGTDRQIPTAYQPLATMLRVESAIIVPLIVRERCLGELMLGSTRIDNFNPDDLQIVSTAAGQLATAVESEGLLSQTDDSLRRRVDQLTAVTRVSRELGASLDIP
ncbi:MAG: GAF domain-containing protein, partial [Anaerolineaceae bacterium]|nr:GAF domain-containing protein [Anaerolineaceae bacterium]